MARQPVDRKPGFLASAPSIDELVRDRSAVAARVEGIVIGTLLEVDPVGRPTIALPGHPARLPVRARSVVTLARVHEGCQVAVLFEEGDASRPIVLGVIRGALDAVAGAVRSEPTDVRVDGERLVLEAEHEIVLRCGKASITLTRDGKVKIRGADVVSRSSGGNRIKGASVRIN